MDNKLYKRGWAPSQPPPVPSGRPGPPPAPRDAGGSLGQGQVTAVPRGMGAMGARDWRPSAPSGPTSPSPSTPLLPPTPHSPGNHLPESLPCTPPPRCSPLSPRPTAALLPLVCTGFDLCACQSPVFESPLQHYVSSYYKKLLESIWIGGLAGTFV